MYRVIFGETPRETRIESLATGEKLTNVIGVQVQRRQGWRGPLKGIVAMHVRGIEVVFPPDIEPLTDQLRGVRASMREINMYPGVSWDWDWE